MFPSCITAFQNTSWHPLLFRKKKKSRTFIFNFMKNNITRKWQSMSANNYKQLKIWRLQCKKHRVLHYYFQFYFSISHTFLIWSFFSEIFVFILKRLNFWWAKKSRKTYTSVNYDRLYLSFSLKVNYWRLGTMRFLFKSSEVFTVISFQLPRPKQPLIQIYG